MIYVYLRNKKVSLRLITFPFLLRCGVLKVSEEFTLHMCLTSRRTKGRILVESKGNAEEKRCLMNLFCLRDVV